MLHVAIKQAVKLHHHLLCSGWDILGFVVTDQLQLLVMDGLVCSFIDSTGIPAADGTTSSCLSRVVSLQVLIVL